MKPKILFFDIETTPNLAYIWGKYEQNAIAFKKEWYIISFAAKWLNKKVFAKSLPDYKNYKIGKESDKELVKDLWKLFDEADILVAQNGDKFDIKKANARFLFYKLKPPTSYKTIDTLKVVRRVASFTSNKLDDLGEYLNEGRKIKVDFSIWLGCLNGDMKSWHKMVMYNKKDVILLEKIYFRLRPWIKNHPNLSNYMEKKVCSKCGSININFRGMGINATTKYKKMQCLDCGGWSKMAINEKRNKEILTNE